MELESASSSRPWRNAHTYRKWLASHRRKVKSHGKSETENFSVEQRSQNVTRPWDCFNKKPRSKRKRSKECWLDGQSKVSEKIKTTVELNHVKNSDSISSEWQVLGKKRRKQRLQKQSLAAQLIELEEGEIPPSPSPSNYFDSTTSDKNDFEAEVHVEIERQTVSHKLKDLGVKIPRHSCYCQKGSKVGKISINSKKGGVLDNLMDMENGEILSSLHDQMFTDKHKEGWDDCNLKLGIPLKGLGTSQLTSRGMEEQIKISNEIVQLGKETGRAVTMGDNGNFQTGSREKSLETSHLKSKDINEQLKTNDEMVQLGKETERSVMTVDDCNCQTVITEQNLGTSQEQLKTHNEIVHLGKEAERPATTLNGLFKVDKIQPADMTTACSGSPKVPAHVSDVLPNKKELYSSTVGTVVVVESDTDSDVVELTGQRSVTSTSNVKNNEANSYVCASQHGTESTSAGKLSPAWNNGIFDSVARPSEDPPCPLDEVAMVDQPAECSGETMPACNVQYTEAKSCFAGLEGLTSVEKQATHKDKEKSDFISKASENLQNSSHEVIRVDPSRPADCSTNDLPITEQSVPIRLANLPGSQDRGAVLPAYTESHVQLTDTRTSVLPPVVSTVESSSIVSDQPPVSSVSVSLQHGLLNTSVSTGIQCPQSVGRLNSSPEVQPPTQPLSEEAVQFSAPLRLPQLRSVQMTGNDLNFFNGAGSRTNVQDFRSMPTGLASMSDLYHANLLISGSTQLSRYDPLLIEIERLKKHHEHDLKMHQDMVLRLKCKRDEDIEQLLKKYDILFQDAEAAMQHKIMDFETKVQKASLNMLLANAVNVMLKQNDLRETFTPDTRQAASDSGNQLSQNVQISADRLDQHPVPSAPVINQPSPVPARPCSGSPMDCYSGLYQSRYGTEAVAPHLRASLLQSSSRSLHYPVPNNGEFMQHLPG